MKCLVRLALLALVSLPALVQAQGMKPGLWEMTQKPQLDPAQQAKMEQAQKQMAAMPPEKRQMMEQMMGQRGMSMGMMAGGVISIKTCISKEQAERHEMPVSENGRCKHDVQRSGKSVKTHFVCTDPASEGDGEFTFESPERYSNKLTIKRGDKTTTITGEARWLAADCGEIKPHTAHQH